MQKPNITTSRNDTISIADLAIEKALTLLNPSTAQFDGKQLCLLPFSNPLHWGYTLDEPYDIAGHLYSQMAEFDIITNQTKYKTLLKTYFHTVQVNRPFFGDQLYV